MNEGVIINATTYMHVTILNAIYIYIYTMIPIEFGKHKQKNLNQSKVKTQGQDKKIQQYNQCPKI